MKKRRQKSSLKKITTKIKTISESISLEKKLKIKNLQQVEKLQETSKKVRIAKRELTKIEGMLKHNKLLYAGLEEAKTIHTLEGNEKETAMLGIYKKEIQRLESLLENYADVCSQQSIHNPITTLKKPKLSWSFHLRELKENLETFRAELGEYKTTIKNAKEAKVQFILSKQKSQLKLSGGDSAVFKPENLQESAAYITTDNKHIVTYYLADIPALLTPTVLFKLTTSHLPLTISIFLEPSNSRELIKKAKQRTAVLEMKQNERLQKGKLKDQEIEKSIEEITQFIYELVHEYEKGFVFSLYLALEEESKENLKLLHKELKNITDALELNITKYIYGQKKAFETTLPFQEDTLKQNKILQSSAVAYLIPFMTKQIHDPKGIFLGVNCYHNSLVFVNPFTIDEKSINNSNINIFGQSGMGKSVTAKLLATRLYMRGTQVIVIDPEGEYVSFAKALGGDVIDFSRDSGMNPFSISTKDSNDVLDHIGVLKTFFKFFIRPQRYDGAVLDKILVKLYHNYPEVEPTYSMFMKALKNTTMYDDLLILEKGSLKGVFNADRKINLNNDLVVFNLAPLGETEEKAPAMYLLSSLIWYLSNQVSSRKKMLFIDEAHNLLVDTDVALFYRKLVKQARKRNMGVVSITQDVQDFLDNDLGKAIITNSETKILLKQSYATIPLMENIFPMSPEEKRQLGEMEIGEIVLYRQNEHMRVDIIPLPFEKDIIGMKTE